MTAESEPANLAAGLVSHRRRVAEVSESPPLDFSIATACCDRWPQGRVALIDARGGSVAEITFGWLAEQSSRLANALAAHGVSPGSRVLVGLPQGREAVVTHLAIARLGAISVPVSVMHGEEAITTRLTSADAHAGVLDWQSFHWLADSDLANEANWTLVDGPEQLPGAMNDFGSLVANGNPVHNDVPVDAETPATILFTSGTTGAPKGALHAHRVVHAHAGPLSLLHNGFPDPGDVFWSPADWAWAGGLIDCLFGALHAGVPIVAYRARRFDPDETTALLASHGVTNTFLPPTAMKLLRSARTSALPRLRSIMTGGEAVDASLFDWCLESFGFYPNTAYGQTEASCVVGSSATLPPRPGSLGMELPGATVSVRDDIDRPVEDGTVGEISIDASSPAAFLGYWGNDEATREKVKGGWLRTGDLGWRDTDGYLWFSSRTDDVILSAGYRIGPTEIEACLEAHPSIRGAAVVGLPDSTRGQIVAAFVETDEALLSNALTEELQKLIRTRLAPYQVPRIIEYVDELPRTVTGKVQRSALRKRERNAT